MQDLYAIKTILHTKSMFSLIFAQKKRAETLFLILSHPTAMLL